MSLFENDQYRWRETYFVLFQKKDRPTARQVEQALRQLGPRYEITDVQADGKGQFESLTLISPYDYAAMDISYVAGEEVTEQVRELREELKNATLSEEEMRKVARLADCNARFDVYHFERILDEEEDEFLDPGALLVVLERLASLCQGVSIDPQSGSVM